MIDHVGFAVANIVRSRAFYDAALKPLGLAMIMAATPDQTESGGTALGYGKDGNPFFWIGDQEQVGEGTHIAFTVDSRAEVDAFHAAALGAGGRDHGAPGLRPQYGPNYYAAYVLDPDQMNIEAVCRGAIGVVERSENESRGTSRSLLGNARVCADIATSDLGRARHFYENTLGLEVERSDERGVFYQAGRGTMLNLFERPHTPSDQTVVTFLVDDIETLMIDLRSEGVAFEEYEKPDLKTQEGMFSDGKGFKTSWFKDPDGNLLSLEQLPDTESGS